MTVIDEAISSAQEISAILKAGDRLRQLPEERTKSAKYEAARRAYDEALRETVDHIQGIQSGAKPYRREEEINLSKLWSNASIALAELDPMLSNICFIKGQGWLDPTVWRDPRYKQYRTSINDMRKALIDFNEFQYALSQQEHGIDRRIRMDKIKILFVSANPPGTTPLKLDDEVRQINTKIRASDHRESIEFVTIWAARPDDLLQYLNEHRPHIVHFSGHGSATEQIILLDNDGSAKPVSKAALVALFRTLKRNIRVVVLNACFSQPQAEAITGEIDCAIGMTRAVGDKAAIVFAAAFYRAIGFGESVQNAFDQGRAALLLEGIPEDKTPALMCREAMRAEDIVLINPQQARLFPRN